MCPGGKKNISLGKGSLHQGGKDANLGWQTGASKPYLLSTLSEEERTEIHRGITIAEKQPYSVSIG